MLEIAVDPGRLFYGEDSVYERWLYSLVDRVASTKRKQAERQK